MTKNKKSTTFKTHFFSALCRSLFTSTSLIFVNSVFVKSVGGENYSQLFFYASLSSLIYYIYFASCGDKKAYGIYKIVIGIALFASVLCFLEPFVAVLEPYNKPLLYLFAVTVVVVDLIGTTLGPVILQLSVNPAIFREVYQKIVTAELIARVGAAALIWVLSINHWLVYWYPVGWVTLTVHFFLLNVTIRRQSRIERKQGFVETSEPISVKVGRGLKFIFANSMVRLAMTVMIWSQVTKFVVECLFYQAVDDQLPSARQIALFVSVATMSMIAISLIVQHLIGKRLTNRLQLSTLFSVQPVNILLLGGLALILPPFWPVVLLLVTYNVINRSIQLPVSRQCLVPVPRSQRGTIVSLICILMSFATMVVSGCMAALKGILHFHDFLVVLLILGSAIFFVITGMDSYYIRNLWSFYREARSGRWQDEPVLETLSSVELESTGSIESETKVATADLTSHPILEAYATSSDKQRLLEATINHRRMLQSSEPHMVLVGLRICFAAGFPWFSPLLERALHHQSDEVRSFARTALSVNAELDKINGYSSVFVRRIKGLWFDLLSDSQESIEVKRLKALVKIPDRDAAEAIVKVLSDDRFRGLHQTVLSTVDETGESLSIMPVITSMYQSDFDDARVHRDVLESLSFGKSSSELKETIKTRLETFIKSRKTLSAVRDAASKSNEEQATVLTEVLHTLFAEEYRLCPKELDRTLTDTIGELQTISAEDRAMLHDMHLEFLKRSELFPLWQSLLA